MGNTYAHVTAVGTSLEDVLAAMAGTTCLVSGAGDVVTVFAEDDELDNLGSGATASLLSGALGVPVLDVLVFDDDVLQAQVFVGGAPAAAVTIGAGDHLEGMEDFGDPGDLGSEFAEMMADFEAMGGPPGGTAPTGGDPAEALVAALARGDAERVRAALARDDVFATETHAALLEALDLPTTSAAWGYRYLTAEPTGFAGELHRP